jgi:hypothetical protein
MARIIKRFDVWLINTDVMSDLQRLSAFRSVLSVAESADVPGYHLKKRQSPVSDSADYSSL